MTTTMTCPEETRERAEPTAARRSSIFVPVCDIIEQADEWIVQADLPGATSDNIDINFERGMLTLHATVQSRQDEECGNFLLREYGIGDFHRTFEIGEGIEADKIHAAFKHGVLTLHLPKKEAVKSRKITVRTA